MKSVKIAAFYKNYMLYILPSSFYISHLNSISKTLVLDNISARQKCLKQHQYCPLILDFISVESKEQNKPQYNPELNWTAVVMINKNEMEAEVSVKRGVGSSQEANKVEQK